MTVSVTTPCITARFAGGTLDAAYQYISDHCIHDHISDDSLYLAQDRWRHSAKRRDAARRRCRCLPTAGPAPPALARASGAGPLPAARQCGARLWPHEALQVLLQVRRRYQ
jgi:hypothetical protein